MSQQYPYAQNQQPQGYQPAPPVKPPKRPWSREAKIGWMVLGGVGIFVIGLIGGNAGLGAQPTSNAAAGASVPTTTVTVTAPAEAAAPPAAETTEPPAATYGKPATADFKLTVKTLTKQCFGSAGCNVTYRILVSYSGPNLDPDATYEVLYQVRGGEDGPIDNKLTVSDGQSSVDEEEMVSTKSSKTKLTVVVTDVLSQ